MVMKNILARIWGRPDLVGYFSADYRPFSAENPQFKLKKNGNFGYFLENFGTFFFQKKNIFSRFFLFAFKQTFGLLLVCF